LTLTCKVTQLSAELAPAVAGMKAGWNQSLDRLFALTSDSPEIPPHPGVRRARELMWKVNTQPITWRNGGVLSV